MQNADFRLQNVFASHLVILSSGHIEIAVTEIIKLYAQRRSNPSIGKFIAKTIERENSLNCEKICKILNKFDDKWFLELQKIVLASETEAIDSLKTLRDQIAHGRTNGTGYIVIKKYFTESCKYIDKLNSVVV